MTERIRILSPLVVEFLLRLFLGLFLVCSWSSLEFSIVAVVLGGHGVLWSWRFMELLFWLVALVPSS
jgi:hypothetical protein